MSGKHERRKFLLRWTAFRSASNQDMNNRYSHLHQRCQEVIGEMAASHWEWQQSMALSSYTNIAILNLKILCQFMVDVLQEHLDFALPLPHPRWPNPTYSLVKWNDAYQWILKLEAGLCGAFIEALSLMWFSDVTFVLKQIEK